MKKFWILFVCVAILAAHTVSFAKVTTFGTPSSFARFSIDLPDGWKASSVMRGHDSLSAVFMNHAQDTTLSVLILKKDNGATPENVVESFAKEKAGLQNPTVSKIDETTYMVAGVVQDSRVTFTVCIAEDRLCAFWTTGKDTETVQTMLKSFTSIK